MYRNSIAGKKGKMIQIGLENFISQYQTKPPQWGQCAILCHAASVDQNLMHSLQHLKKILGKKLIKVFGPQHGFVCDVQDNMVETDHFHHPYFDLPVYSLYGETRVPTDEMLEGVDTLIIDLQDVGTRVYTYITTLAYSLKQCESLGIKVVIFDRPNPIGGTMIEGNILKEKWKSFVGHHPIPMRHGMTMGEMAKLDQAINSPSVELEIFSMSNWKREMSWDETKRTWINPSPNLATPNSALTFPGTVLFEGTNWSEGRGTTRALEVVGAPGIEPFSFTKTIQKKLKDFEIKGVTLKPHYFFPMFQKHQGKPCGGVQIICSDITSFPAWRLGQLLLKECYHHADFTFKWNDKTYEYEENGLAIDYINGDDALRSWVENNQSYQVLKELEKSEWSQFNNLRDNSLLY